jgi:gamma-glutamyltranspeptidase / glutathione hydrolase
MSFVREPIMICKRPLGMLALIAIVLATLMPVSGSAQPVESPSDRPIRAGDRIAGLPFATRSPAIGRNGAAATAHPLATMTAIDVLRAGGSAVDAAIAANAALGVLEPTGNGIGGDLFVLIYDPATRTVQGYNGSGRAALGEDLSARTAREAPLRQRLGRRPMFGSVTNTVPGTVDGWFAIHARHGRLPMSRVLAPAIGYARDGAPVAPVIAHYWERNRLRLERAHREGELEDFANARSTYFRGDRSPQAGETFTNPDLARTLSLIAGRRGRDAFYSGEIARTIDATMRRIGGPLRLADFQAHRGEWVTPISVGYRGYDVWQMPPNSQGLATLQMLGIMSRFQPDALALTDPASIHRQVEAKRLAFADRARYYADPAFSPVPVAGMLAPAELARRAGLIDPAAPLRAALPVDPASLEHGDTTFLVTADSRGMMVALIQSNYRGMGSGIVPDNLGFMLQNRGEAFSLDPAHANVYAPGKRPFHTIIPGMATRNSLPFLAFGVMGGAMQPQGQAQVFRNIVDLGMNVQEAGDAPRWRHEGGCDPDGSCQPEPGSILLESGFPQSTREGLQGLGWTVRAGDGGFGGYQAILWDATNQAWQAGTESRTDGLALAW